ncbi:type I DNA topoisomerase [Butyrivibrio sp. AE2032]|uniref:type I DNA topoisomerase n=1 Tax=Butyrivibrio sp. AE2032 TaxID=1458463 RepID=UPI00054D9350|nr:type I DNA topoisomerase [Butyrivibrio sp. AE2032]
MSKKLVIVESPAKSKTIGRYLGSDYIITASLGHIRDLPSSNLGVDVKHNYKPLYITMKGKEKVVRDLKLMAQEADEILLATDPDREGEAIAWHLAKVLKIDPDSKCRITFNEITKSAVQEAIKNPRAINMNLANAQQARRILDRLVGYELSPLLWKKIRKGLSAGRVQSVATKIVMDRDAEIDAFNPEEYWLIKAVVTPGKNTDKFVLGYYGTVDGSGKVKKDDLKCLEDAQVVLDAVGTGPLTVDSIKKGTKERNPYPPFTTSTLQQEASKRLGFSSKKTMSIAQQLYEGVEIAGAGQTALVSYIRTDSVRISEEAVEAAKKIIKERFGSEYCTSFKRQYKNKNSAQDAHEAIRPTHFDLDPRAIRSSLTTDQYKLYQLIWDRFLATQMASCKLDTVTCQASCNGRVFRASGETVTFKGFLVLYDDVAEDQNKTDDQDGKASIPPLEDGMKLELLDIKSLQKFTTPPPHYTEATLIKALEEYGIGRPSTYAPTISTILERKYIEKDGRLLLITDLGKIVTNMLSENFSEIVDLSFTAEMETKLDEVEEGKEEWEHVLDGFYPGFNSQVKAAQESIDKITFEPEKTGEVCPQCGGELLYKEGRYGKFIACTNFPECNYTQNIVVYAKGTCPRCGSGLLVHRSKKYRNKTFYTCDKKGADPNCDFISWDLPIEGKFCPECGSYMVLKHFGKKAYPRCSNKDCTTNVRKSKKSSSGNKKDNDEE